MRVSPFLVLILACGILYPQDEDNILTGIILDGLTHEIVANVQIVTNGGEDTLISGSDGEFFINNRKNKLLTIFILADGYYPYQEAFSFGKFKSEYRIIHLAPRLLQTNPIVILGQSTSSALDEYYHLTSTLSGKQLNKDIGLTLAATLANESGIAIRSMGPAPARPVIRGLGGERVLLSQDGFKTIDLSATSADHAVTLEPFSIEKIEIYRGAKVLTRSSAAYGGLINTIKHDIPDNKPRHLYIISGLNYESANQAKLGAINIKAPFSSFATALDFTGRLANDLRTPVGIIKNTNLKTYSYSFGSTYFFEEASIGANIREYNSEYGVPGGFIGAHPNGIDISLFRRENNVKVFLPIKLGFWENLSFTLSRNYFRQAEYEMNTIIGSEFSINNLTFNLELSADSDLARGKKFFGISGESSDFNIGGAVFTAPTVSKEIAFFYYGQNIYDNLNIEYSVRYTYKNYNPTKANISSREEFIKKRNFNSFSWSLSAMHSFSPEFSLGINLSNSSRIPGVQELYTEGPHLAAYSYEIGNPNLGLEKNFSKELMLIFNTDLNTLTLSAFHYHFKQFITPRNTGRLNYSKLLPIYQTTGSPSILYGFEFKTSLQLTQTLTISAIASYSEGYFTISGSPLPAIPPFSFNTSIGYNYQNHSIGLTMQGALRQSRLDDFEVTTPGYVIVGANYQTNFHLFDYVNTLVLNIENLLDQEYRNHLSRLRVLLPEAGRNIKVTYKIYI